MKQIHSFDELRQIKDTKVYALGTFDGIHRGHQRVRLRRGDARQP